MYCQIISTKKGIITRQHEDIHRTRVWWKGICSIVIASSSKSWKCHAQSKYICNMVNFWHLEEEQSRPTNNTPLRIRYKYIWWCINAWWISLSFIGRFEFFSPFRSPVSGLGSFRASNLQVRNMSSSSFLIIYRGLVAAENT